MVDHPLFPEHLGHLIKPTPVPTPALPSLSISRDQVERIVRAMARKTMAYCSDLEINHLKQDSLRLSLLELSDSRPQSRQVQNWRWAAELLSRKASVFHGHYVEALQESIELELTGLLAQPVDLNTAQDSKETSLGGMSLSLIDVSEVEKILLLDRVAQRFDELYEAQLDTLNLQLRTLLAFEASSPQRNPFRPLMFVRAFLLAWERCGFEERATEDVMMVIDPHYCIDLAPLYAILIALLKQAGITPVTVQRTRTVASRTSSVKAPFKTPLSENSDSRPAALSSYADLDSSSYRTGWGEVTATGWNVDSQARHFLRQVGFTASQQATLEAQDTQPPYAAPDPELLGYLEQLQARPVTGAVPFFMPGQDLNQQNILHQLRQRTEVRRAPELDRGTVDTLAEVFDFVFVDQAIPEQMKGVIGRLQIPVLKAAMIDRDFFLTPEHPARRLLDTLAQASVAWTPDLGQHDPLYLRIETTVQRVLTEFEDDLRLFGNLLMEFSTYLFETEQQAQRYIEPVAARELTGEQLDEALRQADEAITARIEALPSDQPLAPFLVPFLTEPWCQVMANTWLLAEENGHDTLSNHDVWEHELQMLDQLIWSTQPKINAAERRELVALLPGLVRHINAGLDAIEWSSTERTEFTQKLIATHTLAIRMTQPSQLTSRPAALESNSSLMALQVLDQRRLDNLAGQTDDFDAIAKRLTRGTWFTYAADPRKNQHCRLSWISPMRTRFLFANRDGRDAFVRSEREVAALLRLGRLRLLDQRPVVARALEQIVSNTAVRRLS